LRSRRRLLPTAPPDGDALALPTGAARGSAWMPTLMPVVAVLGAGGFIGNRVVEVLHLRGEHGVRPVVRRAPSLALAARFAIDGRLADARDEAALTEAFSGCTHVVHAVAGPPDVIVGSIAPIVRAATAARVRRIVYL